MIADEVTEIQYNLNQVQLSWFSLSEVHLTLMEFLTAYLLSFLACLHVRSAALNPTPWTCLAVDLLEVVGSNLTKVFFDFENILV